MIFVTERDHLAAALSRVAAIVDRKQTIPILGNLMISAAGDRLIIRATNLDMEAIESIQAVVGTEGETTISASKLTEIVNSLPQGAQLGFKLDGLRMAITSGRTKFTVACLPVSGFPQLWEEDWRASFDIEADALVHLLGRVDYAQAAVGTRMMLLGVRIHNQGPVIRFVATDGFAMAYVDGPEVGEFLPTTIPTKMVTEMKRIAGMTGGAVRVGISDTKVMMRSGDTTITSKVIDRSLGYPEYMRVVMKDLPHKAGLIVADLAGAIRRAMISSQNGKDVSVKFRFRGDGLAVTGQNSEGDALDEISIAYTGEDETISLHPQIMLDVLASLPSELVEVEFGGRMDPTTWRAQGDAAGLVVVSTQRMGA